MVMNYELKALTLQTKSLSPPLSRGRWGRGTASPQPSPVGEGDSGEYLSFLSPPLKGRGRRK
jgi:hypothetical protein